MKIVDKNDGLLNFARDLLFDYLLITFSISCSAFRLGRLNSSKEAGNREEAKGNTQFQCITAYLLNIMVIVLKVFR